MVIFKAFLRKCFGKYLLVTNTVSSGVLMAVGDSMQQQIETYRGFHANESHDIVRSLNMGMVGVILGPVQHVFYFYLDRFIPKRDLVSVSKKLLLDQLIASPLCIITFFLGAAYLEDRTWPEAKAELRHKFLEVYMVDWIVWPPTQFINFFFLPSKYRVIYINGLTTLYNVYLSYVKHKIFRAINYQHSLKNKGVSNSVNRLCLSYEWVRVRQNTSHLYLSKREGPTLKRK